MKRSKVSSRRRSSRPWGRQRILTVLGTVVIVGGAVAWSTGLIGGADANATEVQVYKSPYCGCCGQWSRQLRASGFRVTVTNIVDVGPIKVANSVPPELASCHTALVEGYVVEGHVPIDLVRRLLAERPDAIGIAVPGMPSSAPGMDQPTGESYNVVIFDKEGGTGVYAKR